MSDNTSLPSQNATDLDAELPPGAMVPLAPTIHVASSLPGLPNQVLPEPLAKPTDEETRRNVSYWLLGVLSLLIIVAFNDMHIINSRSRSFSEQSELLLKILNIVFGPVVTLVSSVVGFYFGARTVQGNAGR